MPFNTNKHLETENQSSVATPGADKVRVYSKTDKNLYMKDDTGQETELAGGGSGGGSQADVNRNLDNIMLNAFRIAANGSLSIQGMVDGVIDEYQDQTGIDTVASLYEQYDSANDLFKNLTGGVDEDTMVMIHADGGDDSGNGHVATYVGDSFITAVAANAIDTFGSGILSLDTNTTSYLTMPDSADWFFDTNDYTIEAWVYWTDVTSVNMANLWGQFEQDNWYYNAWSWTTAGLLQLNANNTGSVRIYLQCTEVPVAHTWYHIAWVRTGTTTDTTICYVNGVAQDMTMTGGSWAYTLDNYALPWKVGAGPVGGSGLTKPFPGYFYNFRVSDTARYTSNFTPQTTPFTNDGNTKCLLTFEHDDGLTDKSSSAHVVTMNGTATLSPKFGKGALYLDGTGDYLSFPDSADWDVFGSNADSWTVDFWVAHTDHAGTEDYICQSQADGVNFWGMNHIDSTGLYFVLYQSGVTMTAQGGEITDSNWHHVALCKVADEYGLYLDGTQTAYVQNSGTGTFAAPLFVGFNPYTVGNVAFDGAMDEVRIQQSNIFGAAPNSTPDDTITVPTASGTADGNTKILLHFNGGDDYRGHEVEPQGTAYIDRTTYKWGTGAWAFDGDSDYLELGANEDWDFSGSASDNWTIDLWVKHTDHVGQENYIAQWEDGSNNWFFDHTHATGLQYRFYSGASFIITVTGGEISDTDWHHVALVKVADEYGIYLDGTQTAYLQDSSTDTLDGELLIGWKGEGATYFDGYMDEIRIQNFNYFSAGPNSGMTSTITVPTQPYASGVVYDMTLISDTFTAESQPDTGRLILFEEDITASGVVLNTDIKAYASRDDGTTWTQATLEDQGDYDTNQRILSGDADISSQPSGVSMVYKIETSNETRIKEHGTALSWK